MKSVSLLPFENSSVIWNINVGVGELCEGTRTLTRCYGERSYFIMLADFFSLHQFCCFGKPASTDWRNVAESWWVHGTPAPTSLPTNARPLSTHDLIRLVQQWFPLFVVTRFEKNRVLLRDVQTVSICGLITSSRFVSVFGPFPACLTSIVHLWHQEWKERHFSGSSVSHFGSAKVKSFIFLPFLCSHQKQRPTLGSDQNF